MIFSFCWARTVAEAVDTGRRGPLGGLTYRTEDLQPRPTLASGVMVLTHTLEFGGLSVAHLLGVVRRNGRLGGYSRGGTNV